MECRTIPVDVEIKVEDWELESNATISSQELEEAVGGGSPDSWNACSPIVDAPSSGEEYEVVGGGVSPEKIQANAAARTRPRNLKREKQRFARLQKKEYTERFAERSSGNRQRV